MARALRAKRNPVLDADAARAHEEAGARGERERADLVALVHDPSE